MATENCKWSYSESHLMVLADAQSNLSLRAVLLPIVTHDSTNRPAWIESSFGSRSSAPAAPRRCFVWYKKMYTRQEGKYCGVSPITDLLRLAV